MTTTSVLVVRDRQRDGLKQQVSLYQLRSNLNPLIGLTLTRNNWIHSPRHTLSKPGTGGQ